MHKAQGTNSYLRSSIVLKDDQQKKYPGKSDADVVHGYNIGE